jgi:hypothetical protein
VFHLFSNDKPWFAEKRFGYGAGLPIAWQGWVLLTSYFAAIIGLAIVAGRTRDEALVGMIALLMLLLTTVLVAVAKARTRGDWRWRWGEDD